jgi:hypothetical protein
MNLMYRNILENSTVTVTTENTAFPRYRLYDRDVGKLFKGNSIPANFYITLDQGATTQYEVDRLIIPAGHNLNGLLVKLQYSTDNFSSNIVDASSWTQSGSGLIDKSFTAQTKRYWRLNIAAPASAPQLAEMFLTRAYSLAKGPAYEGLSDAYRRNNERLETRSGRVRSVKFGELRRYRKYVIQNLPASQKTEFESWEELCEGVKSVYITDHNSETYFCEILNEIQFRPVSSSLWGVDLDLLEVL